MSNHGGPEYSHEEDLNRGSAVLSCDCHLIPSRQPPHTVCDERSRCSTMDEPLWDDFSSYRFCFALPYDHSSSLVQYHIAPYPDYKLPHSSSYHFMNPPQDFSRTTPFTGTPEGFVSYRSPLEGVDATLRSVSSEWPDDCHNKTCTTSHQSAGEYSQSTLLGIDHHAACNVNSGWQTFGLNQMQGDGPPRSSSQVQSELSTQPHLPSTSFPKIYQQPSSLSKFPSNLKSEVHIPQLCPPSSTLHTDAKLIYPENQFKSNKCIFQGKLRKPCNCTKSQCLKLYCECFANGVVCKNCKCINCYNNMEHDTERCRAIKTCLDRKPGAFHPKTGNSKLKDVTGHYAKGCNCKRSGCFKNYCECYEAKIMCTSACKCVGCHNYEGSPVRERIARDRAKSIYSTSMGPLAPITPDVVKATCDCLLIRVEDVEKEEHTLHQAEQMILKEFGQCLTQIMGSVFKPTKTRRPATTFLPVPI